MAKKTIPVYLFVGFLESGKTKFIQETMEDPQFDSGDKTLLLVCEEGEEEYNPDAFGFGGVTVRYLTDRSQLNRATLEQLEKESACGRVVLEYNGIWTLAELGEALPPHWLVYQCIATADGTTIKTYAGDNAMRSLLLDKISRSELLVVNRAEKVDSQEDHQMIHKLVRMAIRRSDIAYEYAGGQVAYDDIPDPLPFDIEAPVIEIPDDCFGIWYMDCMDQPEKYDGKTVRFLAQVCHSNKVGKDAFVPGRFAMTCCADDIQFIGFPCRLEGAKKLRQRDWIKVTARCNLKFHPVYQGQMPESKGPVLTALEVVPAPAPAEDVVPVS